MTHPPRLPTKPGRTGYTSLRSSRKVQEEGFGSYSNASEGLAFQWKQEIESLISRIEKPALFHHQGGQELLADLGFSLGVERGILYYGVRVGKRTLRRRILEIRALGHDALELKTSRLNHTESFVLCSALQARGAYSLRVARRDFQKSVESLILRNFPRSKILQSTLFSDLSHSLSGRYVRLRFSAGRTHWAALAVGSWEDQATIDGSLTGGIIWRDYLFNRTGGRADRLALMVPAGHSAVLKSRLSLIQGAGLEIQLIEMDPSKGALEFQDLTDSGNIDTALTVMQTLEARSDFAQSENYQRIMDLAPGRIQGIFRAAAKTVSFRIHGLEFAQLRISEGPGGKIFCGVEHSEPLVEWNQLTGLVARVLEKRQAQARYPDHPFYHLQAERWLESLVLDDIQRIDSRLNPNYVYPQVPAFLAGDRGMIDILTVSFQGRLAVLELKVGEDIELPLQGLDYWMRVRWHQLRGEFVRRGYFRGLELSRQLPVLYFVCPQFCYHSTFPQVLIHIDRSVPLVQVGINENWREGIQVVMRREWNRPFE